MSIGINWKDGVWVDATWKAGVWLQTGTLVPDVVGETQAQGTTDLENAGFVVSVSTAYSSVVPAGIITSQSPAGGLTVVNGSTVTIVVSLGPEPVSATTDTGSVPGFARGNKRKRKVGPYARTNQVFGEEYPISPFLETTRDARQAGDEKRGKSSAKVTSDDGVMNAVVLLLKHLL